MLDVPVLAVERLVNWARKGKHPVLSLTLKFTSGLPYTVIKLVLVMVLDPPGPVAVSLTV